MLFLMALGAGLIVLAKRDGNLFLLFFSIVVLTPGLIHAFNFLGVLGSLAVNPPPRIFIYIQPFFFICVSIGVMAVIDNIHKIAVNWTGLNISYRTASIIFLTFFFAPVAFCDLAEFKNQIFAERAGREPYPKVLEFIKKLGAQDLVLSSNKAHVWFYLYGADEMRKRVFNIMDKGELGDIYIIEYVGEKKSDISRKSIDGNALLILNEYSSISDGGGAESERIAMPAEIFQLAADYGPIKIHKIKPQYVTKRFGLDDEKDLGRWLDADKENLDFQQIKTEAGKQMSIGFNGPFVLRSKEIESKGEGHFSMDINFICIKNFRDYIPYFVNGAIRLFAPSWLGNAWVMDHPFGEKIFNREWRPVIFLSKPEKSSEIIQVERKSYRKNTPGFIRGIQGFRVSYTLDEEK